MDTLTVSGTPKSLTRSQIEDLRLAASKMDGVERRDFLFNDCFEILSWQGKACRSGV
ncbi:MAG: hypothetical protein V7K92_03815 [Nostoc sp.]